MRESRQSSPRLTPAAVRGEHGRHAFLLHRSLLGMYEGVRGADGP